LLLSRVEAQPKPQEDAMRSRLFIATCALAALAVTPSLATAAGNPTAPVKAAPAAAGPELIPFPDAGAFVERVTNRYYPLRPGTVWVYRGHGADKGERSVVRVLHRTKQIEGVTATVVRDRVTSFGKLIELTYDWDAQDDQGRVWYLGENTRAYEDGQVTTDGSWRHGLDGAKAGVVMFAPGALNKPYYQEFLAGEAEDVGVLLDRSAHARVAAGAFRKVRLTKDVTPLEPKIMELKFYAPGVGMVLELGTSPDLGRVELVRMHRP
jgi:hypothetical protein